MKLSEVEPISTAFSRMALPLPVMAIVGMPAPPPQAAGLMPAALSAASRLLNPVASGIFAWIILGEALMAVQIGGGLAVLLGIFVARPHAQIAPAEPAEDAAPPKPVAPST